MLNQRFLIDRNHYVDNHLPLKKRIIRSTPLALIEKSESYYSAEFRFLSSPTTSETCSLDSGFSEIEPLDLSFHSIASSGDGTECLNNDQHLIINNNHRQHRITSGLSETTTTTMTTSRLVCPNCNKVYESSARYRAHIRRHESKQSGRYQCNVCLKNFVQRSSLRTHERIHTGEKPYHCLVCNERFGDFSTFTKHRRTHTGEKPYSCPVCSRSFSQSGNMHRHLKVVHRPRPNLYRQWNNRMLK